MSKEKKVIYEQKDLPASYGKWTNILLVVGVVLSVSAYFMDPERAAFASLVAFMFSVSIGMGAMFLIAIEHSSGAIWSVPFRRVTEYLTNVLYIAPILALPVIISLFSHDSNIYHWAHLDEVAKDAVLSKKASYLNTSSFMMRFVVIWALNILFKFLLVGSSFKQDTTGEQKISKKNAFYSAIYVAIFAISVTVYSVDFMMSLEPHWFSTMFGVYFFSGTFSTVMAMLTLYVIYFNDNKMLIEGIRSDHYYSLGGWMFAFTAFWAYIAFSQFMLIWYANLPEETFWFMPRMAGAWGYVSIGLMFIKFIIPFGLLIQRESKSNPSRLKLAAYWIIGAHIYDLYWLIYPTYSGMEDGANPIFGWQEIGFVVLVIGLIMATVKMGSKGKNHIPIGDPKLERGLNFHL
jgi:hypothetical protein